MAPQVRHHAIEVFFDGKCPLCSREIALLRRRDRRGRIRFTDIASPSFDPRSVGVPYEDLMAHIHGRLPDGELIEGVEVFRRLYAAVGWKTLVALTRLPVVTRVLDLLYEAFARNRLRFTGRCADGSCPVSTAPPRPAC